VRGAARHADAGADLFQVARAIGHGLHDGQAAHQGLRARGRGGVGIQGGGMIGCERGGHEKSGLAAKQGTSIAGAPAPACGEQAGFPGDTRQRGLSDANPKPINSLYMGFNSIF
jgi:hypothetical protein